ncbi:MAG: guanylate kinase [Deltaproteobacteria bacterium]|jgi:guanylate kinase|nr:MAG: guanylate kinase [Deltaproteobacteria bacterium]
MNKEGLLFIISAPSGAGKTSLCKEVVKFFPNLYHSVSYTTRLPRPGEKDGEDYLFVSKDKFQEMIDDRSFVEWAEIHGNRYGTTIDSLKEYRHKGIDIILDIDGQGGRQLKNEYPDGIYVFILPPSRKDLEERLRLRSTDSDEDIEKRLKNAKEELQYIYQYDYIVVNNDLEEAVSALKSIIIAEKCRRDRVLPLVKGLFQLL